MGKITVEIPDDLERRFRVKVAERLGGRRGDLKKAIKEAIENWIEKKEA